MATIQELAEQITTASEAYYNNTAVISDDEYDALVYELTCLDPAHPVLAKVGAEPAAEWKKEKHLIVLGSLNKVNYPHEMTAWITDTLKGRSTVVVEKLDGLSIGLQYQNGKLVKSLLRGNAESGENIQSNVLKMKGCVRLIPNFTGTIRGEIVLTKSDHQQFFPDYSNPRNAASGLCRRLDGEGCEHLTLMCYQAVGEEDFETDYEMLEFISKSGFITPNYKLCKTDAEVNQMWQDYQDTIRASLGLEIDGLVVSCNELNFQQSLGSNNNRPKGKLAFKFANQFAKTVVKKIQWECGNSGRITPVCWVEPVSLLGSTVEKASVYNSDYIQTLGLDVGAEVLICKAGEIIPRIEKVVKDTGTVAQSPSECPSCNTETQMDGKHLICPNMDCPARVLGRVKNWVNELNLLEWGESLLTKLVETKKIITIVDLYKLTIDDLASIDRMGKKSATKCHAILWANTEIDLAVFLGGLSIPLIGQSSIKAIMSAGYDTLDKIRGLSVGQLQAVAGVGPSRAGTLFTGLKTYSNVIDELLNNGVKIKEKKMGLKLSGQSICFTGKMENKRAELEKMAEEAGADVKGSVGKSLSLLVIADPENSTSSKAVAARKFGTKLISEDEFLRLISD